MPPEGFSRRTTSPVVTGLGRTLTPDKMSMTPKPAPLSGWPGRGVATAVGKLIPVRMVSMKLPTMPALILTSLVETICERQTHIRTWSRFGILRNALERFSEFFVAVGEAFIVPSDQAIKCWRIFRK
jgi:hypothetical protein